MSNYAFTNHSNHPPILALAPAYAARWVGLNLLVFARTSAARAQARRERASARRVDHVALERHTEELRNQRAAHYLELRRLV